MAKKEEKDPEIEEIEKMGEPRWTYEDYGISKDDALALDSSNIVVDYLQNQARTGKPRFLGNVFYVAPLNTDIVLDFTTEMGGCSGMYWSYVFQMPKWAFCLAKVSEQMDVSPTYTDAYNLMVGQRQRIEGQIKQGLQSAAQAVIDFELLAHDSRRYREILEYFKDEKKSGDEHILRSLFVDRVDAHTGEGYSMITMAKRWPTIITDFIRMGQEAYKEKKWDINEVMRELDVTQAEATVLMTKNRLFKEWKRLFRPTVASRYSRIQAMVDAREKSIDAYKTWLKPYIVKHKLMKESHEGGGGGDSTNPYAVPALGGQYAFTGVRLWVWKSFPMGEKRKPDARPVPYGPKGLEVSWMIDPLDDFVREWARKIEYKYRLEPMTYNDTMIRKLLRQWATKKTPYQAEGAVTKLIPTELYYALFDLNIMRTIAKVPPPAGGELEDMMINPLRTWVVSQNAMVIHLLELHARETVFDREIDEMIGTKPLENRYLRESKALLLGKEPGESEPKSSDNVAKRIVDRTQSAYRTVKRNLSPFSKYFFRPGPYESSFYERVVKMYLVEVGGLYSQQVSFWKSKAGVK